MIEPPQALLPSRAGPARSFQSGVAPGRLLPPTVSAAATSSRRWPVAFQWRFFLALLLGLAWIGPAWRHQRALYALLLWD